MKTQTHAWPYFLTLIFFCLLSGKNIAAQTTNHTNHSATPVNIDAEKQAQIMQLLWDKMWETASKKPLGNNQFEVQWFYDAQTPHTEPFIIHEHPSTGDIQILSPISFLNIDGTLFSRCTYQQQKYTCEEFNPFGEMISTTEYENGQKSGVMVMYKKGKPYAQQTYHKGVIDGLSQMWDEEGRIVMQGFTQNGNVVQHVSFYKNGQIRTKSVFANGNGLLAKDIETHTWYPNGKLAKHTIEKNTKIIFEQYWDETGQLIKNAPNMIPYLEQ